MNYDEYTKAFNDWTDKEVWEAIRTIERRFGIYLFRSEKTRTTDYVGGAGDFAQSDEPDILLQAYDRRTGGMICARRAMVGDPLDPQDEPGWTYDPVKSFCRGSGSHYGPESQSVRSLLGMMAGEELFAYVGGDSKYEKVCSVPRFSSVGDLMMRLEVAE